MLKFLQEFWRAICSREGRYQLLYAMVREMPSKYGLIARSAIMSRQFAAAGANVQVLEGARFRNADKIRCGRNLGVGNDVMLQAGGGIEFGDDVLLGPGVKIWTQNHESKDINVPIREQGYRYASVTVGDDCWIGANAFILPGVHLPRGCVVAAASLVAVKAYREYSIIAGNPARLLGYRNTPPKPEPAQSDESHEQ